MSNVKYWKNVIRFNSLGGLYTLKTIHFLFLIINSEEIISLVILDGIVIVLRISSFLTNSCNPLPGLFCSLLLFIHNQRLRIEHWEIPRLILFLRSQDSGAKIEALRFLNQ